MKKTLLIITLFVFNNLFSQEVNLPQYLNYMGDNPFMITPAYAGIGAGLKIRLNGLSQWIGVEKAPDTQSLSVETRIDNRFGGGLVLFNDRNGRTSQQGAKVSFASHLTLSQVHNSFFSFGFSYSLTVFKIETGSFTGPDSSVGGDKNLTLSNFDVSFLYRINRYNVSVIISNILDKNDTRYTSGEPLTLRRYSFYNSYIFNRFSSNLELEPSVLVEYFESDKRSRTDLNLKLRKKTNNGYIWAGISYNFLNDQFLKPNSVAPIVGLKRGTLYASYGFGINTNKTQNFNFGSHMITLGFDFERKPSLARCTQKYYIF